MISLLKIKRNREIITASYTRNCLLSVISNILSLSTPVHSDSKNIKKQIQLAITDSA